MKYGIFHKNQIPNLKEFGNWEVVEYLPNNRVKMQRDDSDEVLKSLLKFLVDTDYKAIKFAEGELTLAEYEETKIARHDARLKIRELEKRE